LKIIAITSRIIKDEKTKEIKDVLDIRWINLLHQLEFYPIIIPTGIQYPNYLNKFKVNGIIFSGGDDLSSIENNYISKIRDYKEKIILDYAIKNSIPVYGVCRGMQFIAEYFGSTLKKVVGHVGSYHNIMSNKIFWGTKYLKKSNLVNSYHNYGIDILSDQLINVAISKDESIEAFIHSSYRIFCQMWHPERENPFKTSDTKLIKFFFCG